MREQRTFGLGEPSGWRWRCRSPSAGRRDGASPSSGSTLPSPARPPQRAARRGARGAAQTVRGRGAGARAAALVCVSPEGRTPAWPGRAPSQPLISAVAKKARLVTIRAPGTAPCRCLPPARLPAERQHCSPGPPGGQITRVQHTR